MSDISQYLATSGDFDNAVFFQLFNVFKIKWITQMESCDFIQFLIAGDGMLSNIPQATAAIVNTATQLGTGYENRDTSIYIAVNKAEAAYNDSNNWKTYGQAFQLGASQILKISAGDNDISVRPTG